MSKRIETRSETAHPIILSYKNKLYYVGQVRVHFFEGERMQKAIFSTKTVFDGQLQELHLDITRKLYNILVGYAKLGNPSIILMLHIEDNGFKWCLLDEKSLRQRTRRDSACKYIA